MKITPTEVNERPKATKTPSEATSVESIRPTSVSSGTPTLYIIHGWTYTVEPWNNTLQRLHHMGIPVKMLHVPGLTEPSSKVFTIQDYMRWADANIPDGALALGHSNGGRILLNLCAKNPKKLSNLILLDAAGVYEPSMRKTIVEKVAKIGKPLKKIPLIDVAFHKITRSTDYSKAPANMKKTLTNMLESDKNLDLAKVTTPVYMLWGKKDNVTPPRQATKMYERLPSADLKFYANWTHAPYISNPDELARALANLVTKLAKSKNTASKPTNSSALAPNLAQSNTPAPNLAHSEKIQ